MHINGAGIALAGRRKIALGILNHRIADQIVFLSKAEMQPPPIAPVGSRQENRLTGGSLNADAVIVGVQISRLQIGAGFEEDLHTCFYADVTAILNIYTTVNKIRNTEFVPARRFLYGVLLR